MAPHSSLHGPNPASVPSFDPAATYLGSPTGAGAVTVTVAGRSRRFTPGQAPVLGRDAGCDVVLTGPAVSRRHATLRYEGSRWTYIDLGSSAGSYHEGRRVTSLPLSGEARVWLGPVGAGEAVELATSTPDADAATAPLGSAASRPAAPAAAPSFTPTGPVAGAAPPAPTAAVPLGGRPGPGPGGPATARHGPAVGPPPFGPPGAPTTAPSGGSTGRVVAVLVAAVLVVALLGAGGLVLATRDGGTDVAAGDAPTGPAPADGAPAPTPVATPAPPSPADLRKASVRLVVTLPDGDVVGGSGTVISPDGLILTAAHVVAPDALGQGVRRLRTEQSLPRQASEIEVAVARSDDGNGSAEPAYKAKVVAADGYLDLAVIQITNTASDAIVGPGDLNLTALPIGDSLALEQGAAIRHVGFPEISDTSVVTVTPGNLASFVPDQRLRDNKAAINSTALIAPGNSGGAAVDEQGRIIGVASAIRYEDRGPQSSIARVIPVHLARTLIDTARADRDADAFNRSTSPHVARPTGNEKVVEGKYTVPDADGGIRLEGNYAAVPSVHPTSFLGQTRLGIALNYQGFADGREDVAVVLEDSRGNIVASATNRATYDRPVNGEGVLIATLVVDTDGDGSTDQLPFGSYTVRVLVGGNYTTLADTYTLDLR